MRLQLGPFLVFTALLSAPLAWSQVGSGDAPQSGGAADAAQQQSADGPQPAFTHPEQRPPLALLDEVTEHNYINFGLGASIAWDSNADTFGYQGYSRTLFILSPAIQLRQTRPTLTWYVGANGGLTESTGPGYYNTSNPQATGGFTYQISRHWQLNANDSYLYTSDPFQQYLTYAGSPVYNQPNPTVYTPLTTTQQNAAVLDLTYQLDAHNSFTFTGTESFRRFLHNTYAAYNLYTWGGTGSYQHLFSPRVSAGGAYSFSSLDFAHGQSRSGIQTYQAYMTYKLGPTMSISGWIGPQYTTTKNLVPILCTPYGCFIEVAHNNSWTTAFGGNFGWSGRRNGATASFTKSVSDGGILLGIVNLYQFNGNYIRQLDPRWSFSLGALYGNNTGTSTAFHAQHLNTLSSNLGFTRQLNPTLSATVQYFRYYETQKNLIGYGAAAPKWTDNRIQFTLQYNWGHSLGR